MKKYLVIGNPIEHSLSPKLHNYWIKKNNINAVYQKKKLEEKDLKDLILKIRKKKIDGVNITVPFKNTIIPYLDQLSEKAQETQSVNTVYLKNEKVVGHNTDIDGFKLSIKSLKFDVTNKRILILGAGGVVPSIISALIEMRVSAITLSNRNKIKAENLKKLYNDIKILDWGIVPDFDMVINATSLGLNKHDKINLDFSKVGKNKFFYDVIYSPAETNFLIEAKRMGSFSENGKMMFIFQAAAAFKTWHGVEPNIDIETIKLLDQ